MGKTLAIFILLCGSILPCQAAPPTTESVSALMAASNTEKMLDALYGSLEQGMRQGLTRATAGKPISAEQQRFLDAAPAAFAKVVREELAWEKLKPIYITIYQDNFTQEEVDGLIAFYRSPVGAAFVNKMPAVMQQSQVSMQARMQPMIEKMKSAMEQALKDAQAIK